MSKKNDEYKTKEHKGSSVVSKKKVEPIRRESYSYNNAFWMYISVFLAFLLLLSIITSGFKDLSLFSGVEVSKKASANGFSLDGDYFLGSKNAKVTIIEFSDFQCPFCARFQEQTFPSLKEKYIDTGKANFVFKFFPLNNIHRNALPAAVAAECVGRQGKFYDMVDLLFKKRSEWENLADKVALNAKLSSYAKSLGLNQKDFDACLKSQSILDKVQSDFNEGQSKGVAGTPAFFIGNEEQGFIKISGAQPLSVFEEAINKILSGAKVSDAQNPQNSKQFDKPKEPQKVFVTEDKNTDGVLGSKNAKIVMFEYSDFQCPFCRKFFLESFSNIKKNFVDNGKVRFVYKDFPIESLGHTMAYSSAQAALCAKEQGEKYFWKVHDAIFRGQNELNPTGTVRFNEEQLYSWLENVTGLDVSKVKDCVSSGKYKKVVTSDLDEGQKNGIRGTPSFIILFEGNVDVKKLIDLQIPDGRGDFYVRYVEDQNGRKGLRVVGAQPYSYFEKYLSIQ